MFISTFKNITKPYSIFESWAYDKIVGQSLSILFDEFKEEICANIPPGGRVLDVGCGGGHVALKLTEWRPDITVCGIDLSPQQIERANKRARKSNSRARFFVGDACSLQFADNSFDFVISIGSIKHWPDRKYGLSECLRVLKHEKRFFITEIDRGCRLEDLKNLVNLMPVPNFLKPLVIMAIRTYSAGQSIDIVEASQLMSYLCDNNVVGNAQQLDNAGLLLKGYKVVL